MKFLLDLYLSTNKSVRFMLGIWTVSFATYVIYTSILWLQVRWGYTEPGVVIFLSVCSSVWNVLTYAMIRSGWVQANERRNAWFTKLSLFGGIAFFWASYATVGKMSMAMLMIPVSHTVYAVFSYPSREAYRFAALSLAGIGATMWISNRLHPDVYEADAQIIGFLYLATVTVLVSRLSQIINRMQEALRRKQKQLAQALEEVKALATRDDLTKIHNRRHLTELMEMQRAHVIRSHEPMCLALLDLDWFKTINDRFGHRAGDEVLCRFAQVAGDALRTADLIGRWGGEEFMVAMQDTTLEAAQIAMQRIMQGLRDADFSDVAPGLRVTFSGGLVELRSGESLASAIERADQAMYRAKGAGRNRVESEGMVVQVPAPPHASNAGLQHEGSLLH